MDLVWLSVMSVKAVIFDLGDTLINYGRVDADGLLGAAARLSYDYLVQQVEGAAEKVGGFERYRRKTVWAIKWRYLWSHLTDREFDAQHLLERTLQKVGLEVGRADLEELAWLWYEPLAERATIEPDLHEQLGTLREMGLKLAIISNTFSPPSVLDRHLDKLDLLRFFDFRQYSSITVFRKPDRRIFELTLKQLGTGAEEAVMVGDKIRPDIKGALRAGLRPVFKRNSVNRSKRLSEGITEISRIGELPGLIRKWNGDDKKF